MKKKEFNGFWLPRKNIIFGKWIKHTGWWPDQQLRLFRREEGRLPCLSLHEQPVVSGKKGSLKNPLIHYNYQTVSQFINKLNYLYTENDKNIFLKEKRTIKWQDAIRLPAAEFFKRFFKQEGYKDGLHGLILSLFQVVRPLLEDHAANELTISQPLEKPLYAFSFLSCRTGEQRQVTVVVSIVFV